MARISGKWAQTLAKNNPRGSVGGGGVRETAAMYLLPLKKVQICLRRLLQNCTPFKAPARRSEGGLRSVAYVSTTSMYVVSVLLLLLLQQYVCGEKSRLRRDVGGAGECFSGAALSRALLLKGGQKTQHYYYYILYILSSLS